jgi:type I restriction enzyme S subunit
MSEPTKKGLVPVLRFPEFRDSGEWEEKPLEDVAPLQRGFDLPSDQIKIGTIPVVYSNGVQNFHNKGMTKGPGLVTGRSGTIGKIHFIEEGDFWPHNTSLWVTSFKGNIPKFIYFLYKSIGINRFASGSGVPTLNRNYVHAFHACIPSSLEEQQKIADCLSSIDELVTAQTQKVAALKAHKKGLMQQLFPAEGETVPKLRFPEFRDAGAWIDAPLVRLAKFRRGSFPQPYGLPEWYDEVNGMPFVQVFDVGDDLRLKPKTKNKISKLGAEQSVFIAKGTLIITLQGSIGRVAITQYDAYVDRTLLIFEEFFQPTESYFFAYVIQNLFEIEKEKAPGGIIKTITKEALSDFIVKLPNLSEQQKIANFLSSIDDLITAQAQKLTALKAHKKGLMHQLFPAMDEVDA